jgi:TRAP-type mannitol/chloroaromatic compound transport system substrate-binding protein
MPGRRKAHTVGFAVGIGMFLGTTIAAYAADTHHWRLQTWTWPALEQHQYVLEFAERVEELTGGRLTIEVFDRDAVVPHWESPEAVGQGMFEATMEWPGANAGQDVGFNIFAPPPMSFDEGWQLTSWFYDRGALELMREAYLEKLNLHIAGVTFWQAESLHATSAIRSIDDLSGMTVRTPRGVTSEFFERLGANPIVLPPTEVYGALDRGVVDAAEFLTPSAHLSLGYHQVADYMVWPSPHQMLATIYVAVNNDTWQALPTELQAIVEVAIHEFNHSHAYRPLISDLESLREYEEAGVEVISWDTEEWERAREVSMELWRSYADRSDVAATAIESMEDFMRLLGIIEDE